MSRAPAFARPPVEQVRLNRQQTFATVRLRTDKTKGCGSCLATLTMVFKLAESAQKRWRRLNGHELIGDVLAGIPFTDGVKQHAA